MHTQCSHITQKRGVFYYRRRLPSPHTGEITLSLRTKKFLPAQHMVMIIDHLFCQLVSLSMPESGNLKNRITQYIRKEIDQFHQRWLSTPTGSPAFGYTENLYEDPVAADLEHLKLIKHGVVDDLRSRDFKPHKPRVLELLQVNELSNEEFKSAARTLLQADTDILDTIIKLVATGKLELPTSTQENPTPEASYIPQEKENQNSEKLSTRLPRYLEYMSSEGGWSGQTLSQNSMTLRQFLSVCGDRPLQDYKRKDVLKFYDVLYKLPALWAKTPKWKGKSITEIADESKGEDLKRLSPRTIKMRCP